MTQHTLHATQFIARPVDEVFDFFSGAENLGRITPPGMGFELLTPDTSMRAGLTIDYRIRPLLGIPTRWRTEIAAYEPPVRFIDLQARGPYRRWEHVHTFRSVDGGTLIEDEVVYELPFGPLGEMAHRLIVRGELRRIFRHRGRTIAAIFAPVEANDQPLTVAVAGGTGFVGGAIAAELHRRGHRVVVLSHRGEAARGPLPESVEIRRADVATGVGLDAALAGVDALAIALAFPNSPIEAPRRGRSMRPARSGSWLRQHGPAYGASCTSPGRARLPMPGGTGSVPSGAPKKPSDRPASSRRSSGRPGSMVRATSPSTGSWASHDDSRSSR